MPFVKCSVDGCNKKLQPVLKPDPRDRETWVYRECDVCLRPCCEKHSAESEGRLVCDRCRREIESRAETPALIDLGIRRPASSPCQAPPSHWGENEANHGSTQRKVS